MARKFEFTCGPWTAGLIAGPQEALVRPDVAIINASNIRVRQDSCLVVREDCPVKKTYDFYSAYRPKPIGLAYINSHCENERKILIAESCGNDLVLRRISAFDLLGNHLWASGQHTNFDYSRQHRGSNIEYGNIVGCAEFYGMKVVVLGRAMEFGIERSRKSIGGVLNYEHDYVFRGQSKERWAEEGDWFNPYGTYNPLFLAYSDESVAGIGTASVPAYPGLRCVDAVMTNDYNIGAAFYHFNDNGIYKLSGVKGNWSSAPPQTICKPVVLSGHKEPYKGIAAIWLVEPSLFCVFAGGDNGWGYWLWDGTLTGNWSFTEAPVNPNDAVLDFALSRDYIGSGESCKLYVLVSGGIVKRYTISWSGGVVNITSDNLVNNNFTQAYLIDCQERAGEDATDKDFVAAGNNYLVKCSVNSTSWGDIENLLSGIDINRVQRVVKEIQRLEIHSSREFSREDIAYGKGPTTIIMGGVDGFYYHDTVDNEAKQLYVGGGPSPYKRIIPAGAEKAILLDGRSAPVEIELKYKDGNWYKSVNNLSIQHSPYPYAITKPSLALGEGDWWIVRRECRLQYITLDDEGNIIKEGPYTDLGEVIYVDEYVQHNFYHTIFKIRVPSDLDPQITHIRVLLQDRRQSVQYNVHASGRTYTEATDLHDGTLEWYEAYVAKVSKSGNTLEGEWKPFYIPVHPEMVLRFIFGYNIDNVVLENSSEEGEANQYHICSLAFKWQHLVVYNMKNLGSVIADNPYLIASVNGVLIPRDRAPQCARWGAVHNDMVWLEGPDSRVYWSMRGHERYAFSYMQYVGFKGGGDLTEIISFKHFGQGIEPSPMLYVCKTASIYVLMGSPGIFNPIGSNVEVALSSWMQQAIGNLQVLTAIGHFGAPYPDAITLTPWGLAFANANGVYLYQNPNTGIQEISQNIKALFQGGIHKTGALNAYITLTPQACLFYFEDWNGPHIALGCRLRMENYQILLVYNVATQNWDGIHRGIDIRSAVFNITDKMVYSLDEIWRQHETIIGSAVDYTTRHLFSKWSGTITGEFYTPDIQITPSNMVYFDYAIPLVDWSDIEPLNVENTMLEICWNAGKVHGTEEMVKTISYRYMDANKHHNVPMGFWTNLVRMRIRIWNIANKAGGAVPIIIRSLTLRGQLPDNIEEPNIRGYGG